MTSATELEAPISSKFLVIKFKKVWYICLNSIDVSSKKYILYTQTEIKTKKLFVRNGGIQLSTLPSPSANSKFVVSTLKFFKHTQFLKYTQNILRTLK